MVLTQVGPPLESRLGSDSLWFAYIVCGSVAFFISLLSRYFGDVHQRRTPSFGSAGAMMGILTLFALLYPTERFAIAGTALPSIGFVGIYMLLDLLVSGGQLDIACHIGGVVASLVVLPLVGFPVPVPAVVQDLLDPLQHAIDSLF